MSRTEPREPNRQRSSAWHQNTPTLSYHRLCLRDNIYDYTPTSSQRCRGRSRILQRRVFNPSEMGMWGWTPKAPRGNFFVFLISKRWAFMHSSWYVLTL